MINTLLHIYNMYIYCSVHQYVQYNWEIKPSLRMWKVATFETPVWPQIDALIHQVLREIKGHESCRMCYVLPPRRCLLQPLKSRFMLAGCLHQRGYLLKGLLSHNTSHAAVTSTAKRWLSPIVLSLKQTKTTLHCISSKISTNNNEIKRPQFVCLYGP